MQRGSKSAPEGMPVVRTISCKKGEGRADRLGSVAEVEALESSIGCVPQMVAVKKLLSVEEELKNMKEDH